MVDYVDEILLSDTAAEMWAVVGTLSQGRSTFGVGVDSVGGIFVVGGMSPNYPSAMGERFETHSLQLSVLPPLPQGRSRRAVFVHNEIFHVLGGRLSGCWFMGTDTALQLALALAPGEAVRTGWTVTANALPQPDAFAGMLTGV